MNRLNDKHFDKIIVMVSSICLLLFLALNIFWLTYREFRYYPFVENIPKSYGLRIISIGNYSYSVTKPKYMKFNGNLSITNEVTDEGLIVWPMFPSGYRFAVILNDIDNSKSFLIYINNNGDFLASADGSKETEDIFNQKRENVMELITLANEMWDL